MLLLFLGGDCYEDTSFPSGKQENIEILEVRKIENGISREEHDEFCKRMEAEHHRQNRRLELLENSVQQIDSLATSVEKLALSLQSMVKEQEQQGRRLEVLEGRDGAMWRKVVGYLITTVIGIVVGYIFRQIGM